MRTVRLGAVAVGIGLVVLAGATVAHPATPGGTALSVADSDNDGLRNVAETLYGTDPQDPDTDGDLLPDGAEVKSGRFPNDTLAGADPLRKDVFIELDHVDYEDCRFQQENLERIRTVFADAPITNPDGSTGISVHFQSDNITESFPTEESVMEGAAWSHADHFYDGYHHMVVTPYTQGLHAGQVSFVPCRQPSTLAHELGHALGLHDHRGPGIDSRRVAPSEYPSVMNYRVHAITFSNGTNGSRDLDDWKWINRSMTTDLEINKACDRVGATAPPCDDDTYIYQVWKNRST